MPSGKKRKRHKMAVHKRKKRLRKNRHKKRKITCWVFSAQHKNKLKNFFATSLFFVYIKVGSSENQILLRQKFMKRTFKILKLW